VRTTRSDRCEALARQPASGVVGHWAPYTGPGAVVDVVEVVAGIAVLPVGRLDVEVVVLVVVVEDVLLVGAAVVVVELVLEAVLVGAAVVVLDVAEPVVLLVDEVLVLVVLVEVVGRVVVVDVLLELVELLDVVVLLVVDEVLVELVVLVVGPVPQSRAHVLDVSSPLQTASPQQTVTVWVVQAAPQRPGSQPTGFVPAAPQQKRPAGLPLCTPGQSAGQETQLSPSPTSHTPLPQRAPPTQSCGQPAHVSLVSQVPSVHDA
jgi:hypothetical protein